MVWTAAELARRNFSPAAMITRKAGAPRWPPAVHMSSKRRQRTRTPALALAMAEWRARVVPPGVFQLWLPQISSRSGGDLDQHGTVVRQLSFTPARPEVGQAELIGAKCAPSIFSKSLLEAWPSTSNALTC